MKSSTNPIEKAVAPLKIDAIERARQSAEAEVVRVRAALAETEGDINAAAPYPYGSYSTVDSMVKRLRHNLFHALVKGDPAHGYQSNNGHRPYFVVVDDERVARFIKQRMDGAAADYEAFVIKLVKKIGPVKTATLHGNHVWSYSTLIVQKTGGVTEAWKTQQITNYSKLGKWFNQWPTRKLKHVPAVQEAA